jgi:hypothetical protein
VKVLFANIIFQWGTFHAMFPKGPLWDASGAKIDHGTSNPKQRDPKLHFPKFAINQLARHFGQAKPMLFPVWLKCSSFASPNYPNGPTCEIDLYFFYRTGPPGRVVFT